LEPKGDRKSLEKLKRGATTSSMPQESATRRAVLRQFLLTSVVCIEETPANHLGRAVRTRDLGIKSPAKEAAA
jgi:hypothetical protein